MVAPLVGIAIGAAARAIAKKAVTKAVTKTSTKAATKSIAKAKSNASKIVGKDVSKPGTLEKLSKGMTQSEKRALAEKLRKANVKNKPGLNAKPTQAKDGVVKVGKTQAEIDAKHLAAAYAKSVKASKAAGLDPSKVKVTYKGNTMGYKG
jgi:hypothetical protein